METKKSRNRLVALMAAVAFIFTLVCMPQGALAVVYQIEEDFEDGNWNYSAENPDEPQLGNPDSIMVLEPEFGASDGTHAVKLEWEKQYYNADLRHAKSAEIKTGRANWETDVWEEFYYYFPSDNFMVDSKGAVIKQWIAWHESIPTCNKTFAIEAVNDKLIAHRLWNDELNTNIALPHDQSYLISSSIPKDRWVKFQIHIKFDLDSDNGLVQIWMDEANVLNLNNVKIGVGSSSYGPYAKYGPYVWDSSNHNARIIYADGIKWGYEQFFDNEVTSEPDILDPTALYSSVDFSEGTYILGEENTGNVTIEYDVTPTYNYIDGCMGYSDTSVDITGFSSFAMIIRMNLNGFFDARNGSSYTSLTSVPYSENVTYHVKIESDMLNKKYSVWITPPDDAAVLLAENYDFRSDAPAMDDLGKLCLKSSLLENEFKINNLTINGISISPTAGNPSDPSTSPPPIPTPSPAPTDKFLITEDSYIHGGNGNVNYGKEYHLALKGSGSDEFTRAFFMKADFSSGYSEMEAINATLNIFVSDYKGEVPVSIIGYTDDNWTETGITWNNQPDATGSTILGTINITGPGWHDIDVTSFVYSQLSDKTVTFKVIDLDKKDVYFAANSREASVNKPYVRIVEAEVNEAPVLGAIGAKSVNEGATLSFTVSATDPDSDPVTLSAGTLPTGATFDAETGAFSWTPGYEQAGEFTVRFTVSDGELEDYEDVVITVNDVIVDVNEAPVLGAIGAKSVNEGATLSFTVSATDPDSDPVTLSAGELPAGATFNAETGAFNWTPDYEQAGEFTVRFTVSDGEFEDYEDVVITVNDVSIGGDPLPPPSEDEEGVEERMDAGEDEVSQPVLNATGTAVASVAESALKDAFKTADTAVITIPDVTNAKSYLAALPANALSSSNAVQKIQITTSLGTVTAPANMLSATETANAESVGISIGTADTTSLDAELKAEIGNRPVVELNLVVDGQVASWSNPEAPVIVSIPYTPTAAELADQEHITIWYIDGTGKAIAVPSGKYNAATGKVTFSVTHFSKYAVAFVKKTFDDISGYQWARKQIEVLASKGIINGTSVITYNPSAEITRADFIVLLVKALGLDAKVDSSFDDIDTKAYYANAVGIAKKLGVTTGVGDNRFDPKALITRQDMMTLIVRAMNAAKMNLPAGSASTLETFDDSSKVSTYAAESLAALVESGIVTGDGINIKPLDNATRAETAVMIYRIYSR